MDYNKVIELVKDAKFILQDTQVLDIALKGEADYVTNVDIGISKFLKQKLFELDNAISFFSEEETGVLTDNCWILDPIDGTANLVRGMQMSSISLAHYKEGVVLFGVIYNPFTEEIYTAQKSQGAYLNNSIKLNVSSNTLKDSIIEFGAGSTRKENAEINFNIALDIFKNATDIRRICSSALDLCYIAAGRIDGYFEKVLKPWDIAAGLLILEEAGGRLTDYDGNLVNLSTSTSVVASNGVIHKDIINTISRYEN